MSSTTSQLKSYLSPDEYWDIAKRTLRVPLSADEFFVLVGKDKIIELISEYDQKTNSGRNALPQNGERGISFDDLKKVLHAHTVLDRFNNVEEAEAYLTSNQSEEVSCAIPIVRNCIKIKALFSSKVVLNHG